MANKPSEIIANAKKMISDGYVYVYGCKGEKVTKEKVESLAKLYPNVFSSSIKKMSLGKVGKIGIDCSGFVNKAAGTSLGGSSQIHNSSPRKWKVSDPSHIKNGMYIWHQGHIALLEIDSKGEIWVLEAMGTAYDMKRTNFKTRGKSFTYYGEIKGVDYNENQVEKTISNKINKEILKGSPIVKKCQEWLNTFKCNDIEEDGFYGSETKIAIIKALQTILIEDYNKKLVKVNGKYDIATNNSIVSCKLGTYGRLVKLIECYLFATGYNPQDFCGNYVDTVANEVYNFQVKNKIDKDKIWGKQCWTKALK